MHAGMQFSSRARKVLSLPTHRMYVRARAKYSTGAAGSGWSAAALPTVCARSRRTYCVPLSRSATLRSAASWRVAQDRSLCPRPWPLQGEARGACSKSFWAKDARQRLQEQEVPRRLNDAEGMRAYARERIRERLWCRFTEGYEREKAWKGVLLPYREQEQQQEQEQQRQGQPAGAMAKERSDVAKRVAESGRVWRDAMGVLMWSSAGWPGGASVPLGASLVFSRDAFSSFTSDGPRTGEGQLGERVAGRQTGERAREPEFPPP